MDGNPSATEQELLFLIAHFLEQSSCQNASKVLKDELRNNHLLPKKIGFYENDKEANSNLTYEEMANKYKHVDKSRLLKISQAFLSSVGGDARPPAINTLLGDGALDILQTGDKRVKLPLSRPCTTGVIHRRIMRPYTFTDNTLLIINGLKAGKSQYAKTSLAEIPFKRLQKKFKVMGHSVAVYSVLFDRTGRRILTGADDFLVKIWSCDTGLLIRSLRGHANFITDMSLDKTNKYLVSSALDMRLIVWKMDTGEPLCMLSHTKTVSTVEFSPAVDFASQCIASTGADGAIKIWRRTHGGEGETFELAQEFDESSNSRGTKNDPGCSCFSSGGNFLAVGDTMGIVHVYRIPQNFQTHSPKKLAALKGHTKKVNCIQYSNQGSRIVTGSDDGTARIWEMVKGCWTSLILKADDHLVLKEGVPETTTNFKKVKGITMVIWNLTDEYVCTAVNDFTIKVWSSADGQLLHSLLGHYDKIWVLEFNPVYKDVIMSAGRDSVICVWNIMQGKPLWTDLNSDVTGHDFLDGRFSPDGHSIALTDLQGHCVYYSQDKIKGPYHGPPEQFFASDYQHLSYDAYGGFRDTQTNQPPHTIVNNKYVSLQGNQYPDSMQPDASVFDRVWVQLGYHEEKKLKMFKRDSFIELDQYNKAKGVNRNNRDQGMLVKVQEKEVTSSPKPIRRPSNIPRMYVEEEFIPTARRTGGGGGNNNNSGSAPMAIDVPDDDGEDSDNDAEFRLQDQMSTSSDEEDNYFASVSGSDEGERTISTRANRIEFDPNDYVGNNGNNTTNGQNDSTNDRRTRQNGNHDAAAQRKARAREKKLQILAEAQNDTRDWREFLPSKWITNTEPLLSPYAPQLGDEVVYMKQQHLKYYNSATKAEQKGLGKHHSLPWIKYPDLDVVVKCKVDKIQYYVGPPTMCLISLKTIDEQGNDTQNAKSFIFRFHDKDGLSDILILNSRYQKHIEKVWKVGDRVQADYDTVWYQGEIIAIGPSDPEFPHSPVDAFTVRFDAVAASGSSSATEFGTTEKLCCWDLEPADASFMDLPTPTSLKNRTDECIPLQKIDEILERYNVVKLEEYASPFLEPVPYEEYEDYLKIVAYPIDLSTVQKRLKSNFYRRMNSVQADLKLIIKNCRQYNEEDSLIYKYSMQLMDQFPFLLHNTIKSNKPKKPKKPRASSSGTTPSTSQASSASIASSSTATTNNRLYNYGRNSYAPQFNISSHMQRPAVPPIGAERMSLGGMSPAPSFQAANRNALGGHPQASNYFFHPNNMERTSSLSSSSTPSSASSLSSARAKSTAPSSTSTTTTVSANGLSKQSSSKSTSSVLSTSSSFSSSLSNLSSNKGSLKPQQTRPNPLSYTPSVGPPTMVGYHNSPANYSPNYYPNVYDTGHPNYVFYDVPASMYPGALNHPLSPLPPLTSQPTKKETKTTKAKKQPAKKRKSVTSGPTSASTTPTPTPTPVPKNVSLDPLGSVPLKSTATPAISSTSNTGTDSKNPKKIIVPVTSYIRPGSKPNPVNSSNGPQNSANNTTISKPSTVTNANVPTNNITSATMTFAKQTSTSPLPPIGTPSLEQINAMKQKYSQHQSSSTTITTTVTPTILSGPSLEQINAMKQKYTTTPQPTSTSTISTFAPIPKPLGTTMLTTTSTTATPLQQANVHSPTSSSAIITEGPSLDQINAMKQKFAALPGQAVATVTTATIGTSASTTPNPVTNSSLSSNLQTPVLPSTSSSNSASISISSSSSSSSMSASSISLPIAPSTVQTHAPVNKIIHPTPATATTITTTVATSAISSPSTQQPPSPTVGANIHSVAPAATTSTSSSLVPPVLHSLPATNTQSLNGPMAPPPIPHSSNYLQAQRQLQSYSHSHSHSPSLSALPKPSFIPSTISPTPLAASASLISNGNELSLSHKSKRSRIISDDDDHKNTNTNNGVYAHGQAHANTTLNNVTGVEGINKNNIINGNSKSNNTKSISHETVKKNGDVLSKAKGNINNNNNNNNNNGSNSNNSNNRNNKENIFDSMSNTLSSSSEESSDSLGKEDPLFTGKESDSEYDVDFDDDDFEDDGSRSASDDGDLLKRRKTGLTKTTTKRTKKTTAKKKTSFSGNPYGVDVDELVKDFSEYDTSYDSNNNEESDDEEDDEPDDFGYSKKKKPAKRKTASATKKKASKRETASSPGLSTSRRNRRQSNIVYNDDVSDDELKGQGDSSSDGEWQSYPGATIKKSISVKKAPRGRAAVVELNFIQESRFRLLPTDVIVTLHDFLVKSILDLRWLPAKNKMCIDKLNVLIEDLKQGVYKNGLHYDTDLVIKFFESGELYLSEADKTSLKTIRRAYINKAIEETNKFKVGDEECFNKMFFGGLLAIHLEVMSDEGSLDYLKEVSIHEVAYHEIIKNPKCLHGIFEQLELGYQSFIHGKSKGPGYYQFSQYDRDMRLVFSNSKIYNADDSYVHQAAQTLQEIYFERIDSYLKRILMLKNSGRPLPRLIELDKIEELHTSLCDLPESDIFRVPVPTSFTDYYQTITSPMDLTTMKRKLKGEFRGYRNVFEYFNDIHTILINFFTFYDNEEEHPELFQKARKFRAAFLAKMDRFYFPS